MSKVNVTDSLSQWVSDKVTCCGQLKRIFSFVTNICNWHYCWKILCRAYLWQIKSALHFMLCTLLYIVFCIVIYFTAKYLQKASAVKFVPILSESTFQIVLFIVLIGMWIIWYMRWCIWNVTMSMTRSRTSPMSTAVGFSASQKKVSLEDSGEECR